MKRVLIATPLMAILFKLIQYGRWHIESKIFEVDYFTDYIFFIANTGISVEFINRLLIGIPFVAREVMLPSLVIGALWATLDRRKTTTLFLGVSIALLQYPLSFGVAVPKAMGMSMHLWGLIVAPLVMIMCTIIASNVTKRADTPPQASVGRS